MQFDPTQISGGIEKVWAYDNIAITVLFIVSVMLFGLVVFLIMRLLDCIKTSQEVLRSVDKSITTLNERIGHD